MEINELAYLEMLYKTFHENPELSGEEYETKNFIIHIANELGLCIEYVGNTGMIVVLDSGKVGKTIGIRAELDALPIVENPIGIVTQKRYISKKNGVCHACGHDAHLSIVIALMKKLSLMNVNSGKYIFIFEEGEERGIGVKPMLQALKKYSIDIIYGIHVSNFIDEGKIGITEGQCMAGIAYLDIKIIGKSGHGSRPDLAINPILPMSNIVLGLNGGWPSVAGHAKDVIISITQSRVGTARNIIADVGYLSGTIRFFDETKGNKALEEIKRFSETVCKAYNCKAEFENMNSVRWSPVYNDLEVCRDSEKKLINERKYEIIKDVKMYASDTFGQYKNICKTLYVFLGTRVPENMDINLHSDRFEVSRKTLETGYEALIKLLTQ